MTLASLLDRAENAPRRHRDVQVLFDVTTVLRLEALEQERAQVAGELDDIELGLTAELEAIRKDLRASDPRPGELKKEAAKASKPLQARLTALVSEIEEVTAAAAADLVTFRFTALDPGQWDELTQHSSPREGVAEDAGRAYNMDEVCLITAKRTGVIVVDGDADPVITEPIPVEEWDRIWKLLQGEQKLQVKSTIWVLNEYQWEVAREAALIAARKASEAKVAPTRPSPSASGSRRGA